MFLILVIASLFAAVWPANPAAAAGRNGGSHAAGRELFAEHCASCHGDRGQGESGVYDDPLRGDNSVGELTALIAHTMPEGEPELIVGDDAAEIAAFMHQEFYGPAAQARSRPVRAQLSRLTAEQFRNSIADLYTHFSSHAGVDDRRGLRGTYTQGAKWDRDAKQIEQTDSKIDFDWGHNNPVEGISAGDFRIRWQGSLLPPRSGRYELIVRSTSSFTLNFERRGNTLIDNHVQSGGKTEFRRIVTLIAGRPYHFQLDLKQRPRKTEQPPASVSVAWVPPGGSEAIIDGRYFIPDSNGQLYTIESRLPPDDRSYGYARGTSVDRSWDDATTAAALEFGSVVASEMFDHFLRRHKDDPPPPPREMLRRFLDEFLQVAFRGRVDDEIRRRYIDQNLEATEDNTLAIRRAVLMTLKSPRFLYPSLDHDQSVSRQRLNRMALVLFDSLPTDHWLIKAGQKGQLAQDGKLTGYAGGLAVDPRARAKFREFIYHYLELDDVTELVKDSSAFPGFDTPLVEDLRTSLDTFIDEIYTSDQSDFRELIAADWSITGGKLPEFYGDAWQPNRRDAEGFVPTVSNRDTHVGVLTHPLVTANLAYHAGTSPIHRGVYLTRHVLGRVLRPPNEAFTPIDPQLHPDMTTRQRVQLQTGEVSCQVCHVKINGLGFAMENFDAVGRFRDTEVGKPIDATGRYTATDGTTVTFSGARELGDYLASSHDAPAAFVEAAFEYFVKQPPAAYGPEVAEDLLRHFQTNQYNMRVLITRIVEIAARNPHPGQPRVDPSPSI